MRALHNVDSSHKCRCRRNLAKIGALDCRTSEWSSAAEDFSLKCCPSLGTLSVADIWKWPLNIRAHWVVEFANWVVELAHWTSELVHWVAKSIEYLSPPIEYCSTSSFHLAWQLSYKKRFTVCSSEAACARSVTNGDLQIVQWSGYDELRWSSYNGTVWNSEWTVREWSRLKQLQWSCDEVVAGSYQVLPSIYKVTK